jgi:UDP-N-acetylmuramoyl-tripeptide--D-alanyl-D-alanine ligase
MGARREGDIERLTEVPSPDVGIVTSVAMAHLEYFGDLDGVAHARGRAGGRLARIGSRGPELIRRSPELTVR